MTASGAGPAEHRNGDLGHDEGRAALGGQRVLIVEDDAHATHLLEELLKAVGYEVMTTDSALGTAGLVRRAPERHPARPGSALPFRRVVAGRPQV